MTAPGSRARGEPGDGAHLEVRLETLETALVQLQRSQELQFVQVMKFGILRHLSILGLLVEQSAAPPRIAAQVRERIDEAARRIAQAKELTEVRKIDVALQRDLRQTIAAFKPT